MKRSRFKSYDDLIAHTDRPLAKRRKLNIGRHGASVVPRKFHLSSDEIADLKYTWRDTKRFPNPHNRGFYFYLLEALIDLGIDQMHPQSMVLRRVEALMSDPSTVQGEGTDAMTAWERWANKDPRNKESARDLEGRFDLNVTVLQRLTGLTPYGRRLMDVGEKVLGRKGAVIDVLVSKDGVRHLRLNTHSNRPINETKSRGMGSPAALAEERAAKRKARKPRT